METLKADFLRQKLAPVAIESLPSGYDVRSARLPVSRRDPDLPIQYFVVLYLFKGEESLTYRGIIESSDAEKVGAQTAMLREAIREAAQDHHENGVVSHVWNCR